MEKKDIYEHLAKIYLDASVKDKKKAVKPPAKFKNPYAITVASIAGFALVLLAVFALHRSATRGEIAFVLSPNPIKINYNFDPAQKEMYTIKLNHLDLARFKALSFSVKRLNFFDRVSMRVEFSSVFKEKSEVYFKDLPNRWQEMKINFSEFRNISDWANMSELSFIIEEWNTKEKNGVVLIDNVRVTG